MDVIEKNGKKFKKIKNGDGWLNYCDKWERVDDKKFVQPLFNKECSIDLFKSEVFYVEKGADVYSEYMRLHFFTAKIECNGVVVEKTMNMNKWKDFWVEAYEFKLNTLTNTFSVDCVFFDKINNDKDVISYLEIM